MEKLGNNQEGQKRTRGPALAPVILSGVLGAATAATLDRVDSSAHLTRELPSYISLSGMVETPHGDLRTAQDVIKDLINANNQSQLSQNDVLNKIEGFLNNGTNEPTPHLRQGRLQLLIATAMLRGGVSAKIADALLKALRH